MNGFGNNPFLSKELGPVTVGQILAMIIAAVAGVALLVFKSTSNIVLICLIVGIIAYMLPHLMGATPKVKVVFLFIFIIITVLVGSLSVGPAFIDKNSSQEISEYNGISYKVSGSGDVFTFYDIQDTGSNPNELVASYVDVSYIAFENIFLRGNVSDLEIIHLVGDAATVTLDNSKLYSLFLAHLGDDGKIDTSTMSYSTLSGFDFTGNTTSYTLTGTAYVCAYIALFFFIILGLTTIMRRRLQHTRAKMEAAGRLYPQGYGRCTLCGAIVLPGEVNCRKCGAYIDRPESMKPRKKDYLTCSVCGAEITEDMTECPKCGAKFDGEESVVTHVDGSQETSVEMMVCPVCNKHIPATSERCTYCGKKFDE